jgi:sortase A
LKRALRHAGELMIALGILLASYAVYELWYSNLESRAAGQELAAELQRQWQLGQPTDQSPGATNGSQTDQTDQTEANPTPDANPTSTATYTTPPPKPIALVYIPRLKSDVWQTPLMPNVSDRALALGLGHYSTTAQPGAPGNFAIAGHRATFGEPFARIERLQPGDEVIIQTATEWHVYRLISDRIVQPNENWVLAQTPAIPELAQAANIITLTTCEPRFNSTERWIWFGELVETLPAETPPAAIGGQ